MFSISWLTVNSQIVAEAFIYLRENQAFLPDVLILYLVVLAKSE